MIQIDMPMPKNCKVCPFHNWVERGYNRESLVCNLAKGLEGSEEHRPMFCPLKGCKE